MYQLRSTDSDGQLVVFPLAQEKITIGRDSSNVIVLTDKDVSRKHAEIQIKSKGPFIKDLGSTNGTFVNNERISGERLLQIGDLISMGSNIFILKQVAVGAGDYQTDSISQDDLQKIHIKGTAAHEEPGKPLSVLDENTLQLKTSQLRDAALDKKVDVARYPRIHWIDQDKCYLLASPEFLIGRGPECHLRLSDPTVSLLHAAIKTTTDGIFIEDNKSDNGTYVNGQRISSVKLNDNAEIHIGKAMMKYYFDKPSLAQKLIDSFKSLIGSR